MKTRTYDIKWNDNELTVTGDFYPGCPHTHDSPREYAEFDIISIVWNKLLPSALKGKKVWEHIDVTDLLTDMPSTDSSTIGMGEIYRLCMVEAKELQ